jgi:hypothetical protein
LTPSAINSWVGEELRAIGAEGKLEWRGDRERLALFTALFSRNDAAGVALSDAGWQMTDRPTGLWDHLRLPDILANARHPPPVFREPFTEIDHRLGGYIGLDWRRDDIGNLSLLYYDNQSNPHAFANEFAWHTRFASFGGQTSFGDLTLISQAMSGITSINFDGRETYDTEFQSAFLLAGYRWQDWRVAARADLFASEQQDTRLSEHGTAGTLALTWAATSYLRITTEALLVKSWRVERVAAGQSPGQIDRQIQTALRLSF